MMKTLLTLLAFTLSFSIAAIPVSDDVVYAEAHGAQLSAAVATDGSGYFAVWRDMRAAPDSVYVALEELVDRPWTLMGARVTGSGELRDTTGIVLARDIRSWPPPAVVWSGSAYVVFWFHEAKLMAQAVDREGRIAVAPHAVIENVTPGPIAAASNGSRIVVLYERQALHAAILDANLDLLDDLELDPLGSVGVPGVATNGDGFAAIWTRIRSDLYPVVHGIRLSANGTRLDDAPRVLDGRGTAAITSSGSGYLLSYFDSNFKVALLSETLATQLQWTIAPYEGKLFFPPVWTGTRFAAAQVGSTNTGRELVEISLTPEGRPLSTISTFLPPSNRYPYVAMASNRSTLLTAWVDETEALEGRIAARISTAALPSTYFAPRTLSISANAQNEAAVAHGDGVELAVWREDSGIHVRRIAADGTFLDAAAVPLGGASGSPEVVFDGRQFVVAWPEGSRKGWSIHVAFVSPRDGVLPGTLRIDDTFRHFGLAAGPDGALLTYVHVSPSAETLRGHRIDPHARAFRGTPAVLYEDASESLRLGNPEAAWNGSEYLVTWPEYEDRSPSYSQVGIIFRSIRGLRMTANLVVSAPPVLLAELPAPSGIEAGFRGAGDPHITVASDGSGWLVAWRSFDDVRARRIAAGGAAEDAVTIAHGFAPVLAWDGARYAVAWKAGPRFAAGEEHEIRFASIPRTGALQLLEGTVLAPTRTDEAFSIAATGRGRFTVAYTRNDFDTKYGAVPRAHVERVVDPAKRRATR